MKNKRQIRILLFVLGIVVFVLAYQLGYKPMSEDNESKRAAKTQLQTQVNQLELLWIQQEAKQIEIVEFEKSNKRILEDIPSYISQEDQILFAENLENADFVIEALSMAENNNAYTFNVNHTNVAFEGQALMNAQLTLNYKGTYDQIKKICKQIKNNGNKETLQSINMSFDRDTGKITGTMIINQYARTGDENTSYNPPNIIGIPQGQDSIFGQVNAGNKDPEDDDDGTPPNPDQPELP